MRRYGICLGILGLIAIVGCASSDDVPSPTGEIAGSSNGVGGSGSGDNTATTSVGGAAGDLGSNGIGRSGAAGTSSGASGAGAKGTGGESGAGDGGGASGAKDGGSGTFMPSMCRDGGASLPSTAPMLTPGTWKNISPSQLVFAGNPGAGDPFGQGIVLDPCNPSTVYFCVVSFTPDNGKVGLFRSTDAGSTWTRLGSMVEPVNLAIDPKNTAHLYVADGVRGNTMGFWVSRDGGQTWTMPDGFKTAAQGVNDFDVYHVEADPTDFEHVLVTFHYGWSAYQGVNSGVFESFDGGDHWTIHQPDPGWAGGGGFDVFFLYNPALGIGDNKTWLYGTQGKGYWRTTNAGASWTKVTDVSMEHGGGQLYYTKSGVLYVSGTTNIIRSKDNGATWTKLPLAQGISGFLSVTGDGTNLYAGGHGGGPFIVAKESDDTTWTVFNAQTFAEGPFEMALDSANGILYSSNIRGGAWALKLK